MDRPLLDMARELALFVPAGVAQAVTGEELAMGLARLLSGLAVAAAVYRLVRRLPWPRPFRLRFALVHLAAAPASALTWLALYGVLASLMTGRPLVQAMMEWPEEFMVIGVVFYAVVAGVSYAVDATARAARAEAAAAQTRLAALRAQLQPHFLFNALHTVVQLIPGDPDRAVAAAELVADLLRATLDEDRDAVSLGEEWTFVSRYLELERIRFGDRLRVAADVDPELFDVRVPSFALQTLVENAVRHGAAPRVAPTDIVITATGTSSELTLSVRNTADFAATDRSADVTGTGLKRLRERLAAIHGGAARLVYGPRETGEFEAVLILPRERGGEG